MSAPSAEPWPASAPRITPEVLRETLRYYNLSRQEFISTYKIPPLVYVAELPRGAKTAFVVIYALIFALALSGNSLVLSVVLRKRAARTATDVFICSLAVSDLLITFFCVPFTLLQNITSQWVGGVLVCKTVPFVQTTAVVTGILTMTCIAIERYLGIVFPLRMRRRSTSRRAYKMLGICHSLDFKVAPSTSESVLSKGEGLAVALTRRVIASPMFSIEMGLNVHERASKDWSQPVFMFWLQNTKTERCNASLVKGGNIALCWSELDIAPYYAVIQHGHEELKGLVYDNPET